jgi:hypothetical protein
MTTAQIITYIILYLMIVIPPIYLDIKYAKGNESGISVFSIFPTTIVFIILYGTIVENKNNNKCPEYEKVENVYKLKE